MPIVYARSRGRLWSPIDGKPKRGGELARVRHLRARPEVSLLLDECGPDWSELWWIQIDATAEIVRASTRENADVSAAIESLERKYPQYENVPLLREPPTLIAFTPMRITSWSASG